MEEIRLLNFLIISITSCAMFVYFNDSWAHDSIPQKMIRFGAVGFFAVVSAGSLETYLRGSELTIVAWVLGPVSLVVLTGIILHWMGILPRQYHSRATDPPKREGHS